MGDVWAGRHEPTLTDLEREFPGWRIAKAPSGLWYANKDDSPLLQGEDTTDLRDMINGWIGRSGG